MLPDSLDNLRGKAYPLTHETQDDQVQLHLWDPPTLIGGVKCKRQTGHHWELKDIWIANAVSPPPRQGIWGWIQERLGYEPRPINYRQQGLGTGLLQALLDWAKAQGVQSIQGTVYQPDIENNPKLLQWYQRQGFQALPPDEAPLDAIAIIHFQVHPPDPSFDPALDSYLDSSTDASA